MVLYLENLRYVFRFIKIYTCIFCKKFVALWTLLILVSLNVSVSLKTNQYYTESSTRSPISSNTSKKTTPIIY